MENEIWKDAIGFEGYYQISNLSNVRSIDRQIYRPHLGYMILASKPIKSAINKKGYRVVYLCVGGKKKAVTVHRLIAKAFIENPLNRPEVNHKDSNTLNNSISNLEWVTHQQNMRHAYDKGRIVAKGIPAKKPVIAIKENITIGSYPSLKEAGQSLGLRPQTISDILCGRYKTRKGYSFQFV